VILLVAHDLFDAVALRLDRFDLLGCSNQRLATRRDVALVGVRHGHAAYRAGLEINGMLRLLAKCVRPSFIFVIFVVRRSNDVLPTPLLQPAK
jgi:hypothetical protein